MSGDHPTVLVTGGAGFIGSHLVERLLASQYRVVVLDDLSTGTLANLRDVVCHPALEVEVGSVTDTSLLNRAAKEAGVIVHLAAVVGVELVLNRPVETIETNIRGTENVLDIASRAGKRVLLASTSEVYGKGTRYPFRENDDVVLGPTSTSRWAYAASKMIDEFLCFAYHQEFGVEATPLRLFNTVGARQTGRYGMVIPRLVRQALRGEDLTVYGDGTQRRCFCDVRDVVRALVGLIERVDAPIQTYNIGGSEEVSILSLAERIKRACGSKSSISFVPYERAYPPGFEDMARRVPDCTRLQQLLGWKPQFNLDDIIVSVIEHERQAVS